jgi:hypothetical protein
MAAHRFLIFAVMALAGCGGGGNSSSSSTATGWVAGVFPPSASFAGQCTTLAENNYLRSWTNENYLWFDEVVDRNPALSTTPAYFDLLKTTATTPSGNPKDRFHFTFDTAAWNAFSQSGVSPGYGAEFIVVSSTPPRRIVVAYTEPGSPATGASLARGAEILTVDGVDAVNNNTSSGVDVLNAGLFPDNAGETHTFTVRDIGSVTTRTVSMQSANVTETPVQNVITNLPGQVGYLLFNDHIATAETELVSAINTLKAANITDLVLDIRYNGGGFLDIAGELAYMIAGTSAAGRTFEQTVFNSKIGAFPPSTFPSVTLGFSLPEGQPLPTLNLPRVFVLTGTSTCSASESIINSLRGIGVTVIQIGSTTCGKPYGFFPQDNCGTTYFSIMFRGVNAAGFGDYADGFSPQNTVGAAGTRIPGCSVGDDFNHPLGDPAEARLAAALNYRLTSTCPAPSGFAPPPSVRTAVRATLASPGAAVKSRAPWRENRLLRPH